MSTFLVFLLGMITQYAMFRQRHQEEIAIAEKTREVEINNVYALLVEVEESYKEDIAKFKETLHELQGVNDSLRVKYRDTTNLT